MAKVVLLRSWGSQWGGAKVHLRGDGEYQPYCMNRPIHCEQVEKWPMDPFSPHGDQPIQACKKCFPKGKP